MADVLVIDDDPQVRKVVARLVRLDGHEVREASDGREALALLADAPSDLVVTDIYMPGMDGIECIVNIRRSFPDTRIIAMSGGGVLAASHMLGTAKALGAVAVVEKPFDLDTLRKHMEPAGSDDDRSSASAG